MKKAKLVCESCGHDEYMWTNKSVYERKRNAFLEFIENGWKNSAILRCARCGHGKFVNKIIE
jgi:ribosomal protein L37E